LKPAYVSNTRQVLHRDLKPANVLVTRQADGGVHIEICDFNLAREFEDMTVDTEPAFGEHADADAPRPATPPPAAAVAPAAGGVLVIPGRNSPPPLQGQKSDEVVSAGYPDLCHSVFRIF
jgi:serine/threonine protein kinase